MREALELLAQCGVQGTDIALRELAGKEDAERDIDYARLSGLVEAVRPRRRPAVFFMRNVVSEPAFEAASFGTGNSRTRPALAGTVWLTAQGRDTGVALAHELAHVLMDSGEHAEEAGNLMRDETAPWNRTLTPAQCGRMRERGTANGWLQPVQ